MLSLEAEQAIVYFEDAIRETDEIILECSEQLQAELKEQKKHFIVALSALNDTAELEKETKLRMFFEKAVNKPEIDPKPYKSFYKQIKSLHSCEDCARDGCFYKPKPDAPTRINCPMWLEK